MSRIKKASEIPLTPRADVGEDGAADRLTGTFGLPADDYRILKLDKPSLTNVWPKATPSISTDKPHYSFDASQSDQFYKTIEKPSSNPVTSPILLLDNEIIKRIEQKLVSAGFSEAAAREVSGAVPDWLYHAPASLRSGKKWNAVLVDMIALPAIQGTKADRMFSNAETDNGSTSPSILGTYSDHRHDFPSAEAFLKTVYGDRLGKHGDLHQAELRKLDSPLMDALNIEFRGNRRAALRSLLPSKSERLDQKLEAALGYVPSGEERRSALTSLARGHKIGIRKPAPR